MTLLTLPTSSQAFSGSFRNVPVTFTAPGTTTSGPTLPSLLMLGGAPSGHTAPCPVHTGGVCPGLSDGRPKEPGGLL